MLWTKGDGEGEVSFILGHGREGDILRVREIGFGAAIDIPEELSHFAYAVRAVVEEEESIVIWQI